MPQQPLMATAPLALNMRWHCPLLSTKTICPVKANITKGLAKQAKIHVSLCRRTGGTHYGDDH
ncbi:hypothetical protein [Candidatus Protochlamydia amoebophila]|uniref:Uncharacterized protein n=1 Tax=Candidatus Protochlamydia amoebophila TaxID=362787 RepID=A0A0C1GYJ6_9BACT|nr:hypothetical protein [Candidatus Protochlamydia amoebophila]KIC70649.1 hypothetical protein DB44_HF00030 [Candidatus Protochlamydia amoebophila]